MRDVFMKLFKYGKYGLAAAVGFISAEKWAEWTKSLGMTAPLMKTEQGKDAVRKVLDLIDATTV